MAPLSLCRVPKSACCPVIFVCFIKRNHPREGPLRSQPALDAFAADSVVVMMGLYTLLRQFLAGCSFYLRVSVPQFNQQLKDWSHVVDGQARDLRELVHEWVEIPTPLCSPGHKSFKPAVTIRSPRRSPLPHLIVGPEFEARGQPSPH